MKSIAFLLAAGILILPAAGETAEEIHSVMAAEEHVDAPRAADNAALEEEMEDVGGEPAQESTAPADHAAAPAPAEEAAPAASADVPHTDVRGTAAHGDDAAAYGAATAIAPVTLREGDWVFIEGDERRGWFFDRTRMQRNSDGTISYWQLILYNELGRVQFARAMHDTDYEQLRYTLQRRVLDLRQNTVRTYEIRAYDGAHALIAESARDGHPAEIRPNTMAEKEREAVRKAVRGRKQK